MKNTSLHEKDPDLLKEKESLASDLPSFQKENNSSIIKTDDGSGGNNFLNINEG